MTASVAAHLKLSVKYGIWFNEYLLTWESNGMKIMNSGMCKMRDFSATINTVNVNAELSAQGRALLWVMKTLASLQGQLKLGV